MVRETYSEQETFELGKEIGESAQSGDVFTLEGDLGVGKTIFTKGLAYGLGVREDVVSPTFTIVQEYEDGRLPFYHLTCTASVTWKRWRRSATRTVFTATASAWWNGPI